MNGTGKGLRLKILGYFRCGSRVRSQFRVISFVYFISTLGLFIARSLAAYGLLGSGNDITNLNFTLLLQLFFFLLLPFFLYKLLLKKSARETLYDFNVRKPALKDVAIGAGLGVSGLFVSMGLSTITMLVLLMMGYTPSASEDSNLYLSFLLVGVLPAIGEEFIYRGALTYNLKKVFGLGFSIALVGIMFGLGHMYPPQTVYTLVMGVTAALLTVKSRSIFPAVTLHAVNNLLSVLIDALVEWKVIDIRLLFTQYLAVSIPGWFLCLGISGALIYLFLRMHRNDKEKSARASLTLPAYIPPEGAALPLAGRLAVYDAELEEEAQRFKPGLFDSMFLIAGIFCALAGTFVLFIAGYIV